VQRELSQQEIDAVFEKMDGAQPAAGSSLILFDFRRADRISKTQLRAIHALHESFVRNLVSSLSAYLDAFVQGNLVSVEQLPLSDLIAGMPQPTCLVSLNIQPGQGSAAMEINTGLVYSILDKLLGGKGSPEVAENREMTDVEERVLEGVLRLIVQNLTETWKTAAGVEFQSQAIESDPSLLRIVKPSESLVAIALELRVVDTVGLLTLAIPSVIVKSMSREFERQWADDVESSDSERMQMFELLLAGGVELESRIEGARLRTSQVLALEPGDILMFGCPLARQVDGAVNGRPKFKGRVVDIERKRALLIEQPSAALKLPA